MLKETSTFGGINSADIGIVLQKHMEFSEPVPVYESEQIPGRNGNLIFETGAFENRTGIAKCFALQRDVEKAVAAVNKMLFLNRGYARLESSDDPDHYWMAKAKNGAMLAQRVRLLAPFDVEFDCKPQRFLIHGENELEFSESGTLNNEYGFDARPLIIVVGSGNGVVRVGGAKVTIKSMNGTLYLDSETQNAYNNDGNQNMNIEAIEFPVLSAGENEVYFSGGVTGLTIIPRWWEL